MNEETYLKETVGTRNAFQVPDGYFEQLTQRVIQQLPERQQSRSRLVALRPWIYSAAASLLIALAGVTFYFQQQDAESQELTANVDASYIDEAVDYALIDNTEIYAYLAE